MKVLREQQSVFATRPHGIVKSRVRVDSANKFGKINSMFNAGGATSLPSILPAPADTSAETTTTPPSGGAAPIPTPPASATPPATDKPKDEMPDSTQHYIAYAVGGVIGGGLGYLIAERNDRNIFGGMLFGAATIAGGVYLFINGGKLLTKKG